MARATRAVANKQSTEMTFDQDAPSFVDKSSMRGNEEVSQRDITIPRLDILQALSPQIDETDAKYIEGAKQGQWFNTVTNQLYGNRVIFVPVYFKLEYVIWRDIKQGGGFRGAFDTEAEAAETKARIDDGESCEIVDTGQHYGILLAEGLDPEEIVLSCSRTKHKPSRKLNTLARKSGGDRFASAYSLEVVSAENAANQKYWNFDPTRLGWVNEEIYRFAEEMYEAVKSGARAVDRNVQDSGAGGTTSPEDLDR